MNRRIIRNIVILGTISLVGIVLTQLYWIRKAWDISETQFNHNVNVALRNVANELLAMRGDTTSYIEPVQQISTNYFLVSINDTLHPYLLESLLKAEFKSRNINLDFEYGIYDCFTNSMVYGNYVYMDPNTKKNKKRTALPIKWDRDGHYFGVYFPDKSLYLVSQMGIWLFSSLILLVVVVFFSYTMFVILKQKRLSEITTDFINNMTHEFKTPISTISLSSEVLMKPDIINHPERLKRYSRIIREENARLQNMVERVLQMASLDKADYKLNKDTIDVHELIEQTIDRFSLMMNEKGGKFIYEPNATKSSINADKVHVGNILANLIDNAIKYSKNEPQVNIKTANKKQGIVITIEDKGIGMSREAQKQVFKKFYRVSTGNVHDVKGFGLGLNYVEKMVRAHNGTIKLQSELGRGSRFDIYMPFA